MPLLKCDKCDAKFSHKCGLLSHMRKHAAEELDCPDCHFTTDDEQTLSEHRRTCEFREIVEPQMTLRNNKKAEPPKPEPVKEEPEPRIRNRTKTKVLSPLPVTTRSVTPARNTLKRPPPPQTKNEAPEFQNIAKRPYRKQPNANGQGVNENSAPSSRKVSFLLSNTESNSKNSGKSTTSKDPIIKTANGNKSNKLDEVKPTGTKKGKKNEPPPLAIEIDRGDLYFPLPPGSKFAPPGGDPGFPKKVELDINIPRMKETANFPVPSWAKFVNKPTNNTLKRGSEELSESGEDSSRETTPEPASSAINASLRPPKLEDFRYITEQTIHYGQERHLVEMVQLFEQALEDYEKRIDAPYFAVQPGSPSIRRAQDYFEKEAKIEKSRQCPDCPFKKSNLKKFRAHRQKHELGGKHKCKECNYSSHSSAVTEDHMFIDHYLNDYKVLEGISSSESEDEDTMKFGSTDIDVFVPYPKSPKKGRKRRRNNW
ncbi:hypothetical protein CAEBREN_00301 [Caenorhabditis brenneri]|uniref:C2H2-type domain-containing protein n=1 Tax=Caenorhabditis brenneri TaxID=135651 RepID=G0NKU0_CAEBE|nr:hypothetical protein CAEBREN_00301 [Caenorhabditis brenneri]